MAQIMSFLLQNSSLNWRKQETTRPFRYDLNQIPYDYTVVTMNRLTGLDLVDWMPEKLWTKIHNTVQEATTKTIPKKKKCKNARGLSEKALEVAEKRREAKGKWESEKCTQLNSEFQRTARRDMKAFLNKQCKTKQQNGKRLGISSRKLEVPREHFMQTWAQVKDRNSKDLTEAEEIKKWG